MRNDGSEFTREQAIDIVRRVNFRYINFAIDRWCAYYPREGKTLRFSDDGLGRLGQVFGWIEGLRQANVEVAAELAYWFIRSLDRLAWCTTTEFMGCDLPIKLVELQDDGLFATFRFSSYYLVKPDADLTTFNPHLLRRWPDDPSGRVYAYDFNGGLVFHGFDEVPGQAPTLTVKLGSDDCPWSLHT